MPLTTDKQVLATSQALVTDLRAAFHTPETDRPAHARGHLLRGTFTPTPLAATLSTAPHFNNPTTPLLARFSSSTGLPQIPDTDPSANPRGLAIRFLLSADGHTHTDIITHSSPLFPARTGEAFLSLVHALGSGDPATIAAFMAANPAAAAFRAHPNPSPASFAAQPYFGIHAFFLRAPDGARTPVRYRLVPEGGGRHALTEAELAGKSASYLFDELRTHGRMAFALQAQVGAPEDPTDDSTRQWPEEREVVELGRVEFDEVLGPEEDAEVAKRVIFDPVPRVEGVEASADPLIEVRAAVYLISGRIRREAEVGGCPVMKN